jgi:hypothetical protein
MCCNRRRNSKEGGEEWNGAESFVEKPKMEWKYRNRNEKEILLAGTEKKLCFSVKQTRKWNFYFCRVRSSHFRIGVHGPFQHAQYVTLSSRTTKKPN